MGIEELACCALALFRAVSLWLTERRLLLTRLRLKILLSLGRVEDRHSLSHRTVCGKPQATARNGGAA